jgi:hypothetical protein
MVRITSGSTIGIDGGLLLLDDKSGSEITGAISPALSTSKFAPRRGSCGIVSVSADGITGGSSDDANEVLVASSVLKLGGCGRGSILGGGSGVGAEPTDASGMGKTDG